MTDTTDNESQPAGGDGVAATPSSRWAAEGRPDPHANRYACERAALAMGDLTDDELANAVSSLGDSRPTVAEIMAGAMLGSAYLTAAKDRIRWLSRRLATAEQPATGQAVEWDGATRTMQEHLYLMTGERERYKTLYEQSAPKMEHMERRITELAASGQGVGDGVVLVPREPTPEMQAMLSDLTLAYARAVHATSDLEGVYRRIVEAAAPTPPAGGDGMVRVNGDALMRLTEPLAEQPEDWDGPCWCATCRSYAAEDTPTQEPLG